MYDERRRYADDEDYREKIRNKSLHRYWKVYATRIRKDWRKAQARMADLAAEVIRLEGLRRKGV